MKYTFIKSTHATDRLLDKSDVSCPFLAAGSLIDVFRAICLLVQSPTCHRISAARVRH